jgi:glycosyltransferase involved in cell wall biosynthesis
VTDHVGAQGAVTPDTGWIVPAGDVSALAARMRWCVENAGVLEGMRQKCRRMAETFSWRSYEDNVHKVFDEMCS